jgi:hypothetical protein
MQDIYHIVYENEIGDFSVFLRQFCDNDYSLNEEEPQQRALAE